MLQFRRPTHHIRLRSGSLNPSNPSRRLEAHFPGDPELQDQNLGVSVSGARRPPIGMLSVSRSWGADAYRGKEPGAEVGNGILLAKPSRNPHPDHPGPGSSPPLFKAHHPPSQQAGRCTPLSRPQGEPQAPLPPDAARWNAGVRTFPEVSPGLTSSGQSAPPWRASPYTPPRQPPA
jgi:hypothetical protein